VVTTTNVQVNPGVVNTFQTVVDNAPPSTGDPADPPAITSLKLAFRNNRPEVVLTGQRFLFNNPLPAPAANGHTRGSDPQDLEVRFTVGNYTAVVRGSDLSGTATELHVPIPNTVVVGLATIQVVRPNHQQVVSPGGAVSWVRVDRESNE